jgi:hypothetical protein
MEKPKVEEWREHLRRNLEAMAGSWSNLAEPVAELLSQLLATPPGGSFPVTPDLRRKLEDLQKVIQRCPVIQDHPTPSCAG